MSCVLLKFALTSSTFNLFYAEFLELPLVLQLNFSWSGHGISVNISYVFQPSPHFKILHIKNINIACPVCF
jgi:hypothetical protein